MSGGKTTMPVKTRNDKQSQCLVTQRSFFEITRLEKSIFFLFCILHRGDQDFWNIYVMEIVNTVRDFLKLFRMYSIHIQVVHIEKILMGHPL